jgi:hypothetical protein
MLQYFMETSSNRVSPLVEIVGSGTPYHKRDVELVLSVIGKEQLLQSKTF